MAALMLSIALPSGLVQAEVAAQRHKAASRARPDPVTDPSPPVPPDPLTQPCAKGVEDRASGLCAQWAAADAARAGAKGLAWLVFASILAAVLSCGAAIATVMALRENRKTADMLAKAFESGRALVLPRRAFVTVQVSPQLSGDPDYRLIEAGFDWRNFGERPALQVQVRQALLAQPRDVGAPVQAPADDTAEWFSLAAGEDLEGRIGNLPHDRMGEVVQGLCDLYLVGEVWFRDQLDPDRIRQELYVMRADVAAPAGNDWQETSVIDLHLTRVEAAKAKPSRSVRGAIESWILDRKALEIRTMLSKLGEADQAAML